MQIGIPDNKEDSTQKSKFIFFKFSFIVFLIICSMLSINGCARWPNSGGGEEKKLLIIKVDINDNGKINTDLGKYYIVLDTRKEANQPPSKDLDDWISGYHYILLDNMGFCFGKWGSICQSSTGVRSEKYIQFNLDLDVLGNPDKIYLNVITTGLNDKTYDYIDNPSDLTIDTRITNFNKVVQDFMGDSTGGPDFDIIKVTISILNK